MYFSHFRCFILSGGFMPCQPCPMSVECATFWQGHDAPWPSVASPSQRIQSVPSQSGLRIERPCPHNNGSPLTLGRGTFRPGKRYILTYILAVVGPTFRLWFGSGSWKGVRKNFQTDKKKEKKNNPAKQPQSGTGCPMYWFCARHKATAVGGLINSGS